MHRDKRVQINARSLAAILEVSSGTTDAAVPSPKKAPLRLLRDKSLQAVAALTSLQNTVSTPTDLSSHSPLLPETPQRPPSRGNEEMGREPLIDAQSNCNEERAVVAPKKRPSLMGAWKRTVGVKCPSALKASKAKHGGTQAMKVAKRLQTLLSVVAHAADG